ncbi:hypothetical protein ACS0TY_031655 [Phlomoides rotata]
MEVDDIQCKYPRISNGSNGRTPKIGHNTRKMDDQYPDEEDEGDNKRINAAAAVDLGGGVGRFYGWPSSRIVRVSRASGGKDRHSKVLTSKGLRDRRVRLSVNTAIQFYDLQDRLGYDQPSKAVEWLLKAAATSISELPPMNSPFPETPKQQSDDKRSSTAGSDQLGFDSAELDLGDPKQVTACSSTSETSKGSGGLSLSRSESRIKARERAKGRVAEKEKENDSISLNPISQTTSFTELLNGGTNNVNSNSTTNETNLFLKSSPRQWSTMDYFTSGLLAPSSARSGQMGNPFTTSVASPLFSVTAEHHHPELQHFSFVPDHLVPVVNAGNNNSSSEYNLNFTISPCANSLGFNRGTLQSNSSSPSLMPHLQRFPDGPAPGFFIGTTAAPVDNHHQFLSGYDSRLQLCYGDPHANNGRHSANKGKGKN